MGRRDQLSDGEAASGAQKFRGKKKKMSQRSKLSRRGGRGLLCLRRGGAPTVTWATCSLQCILGHAEGAVGQGPASFNPGHPQDPALPHGGDRQAKL